MGGNYDGLVGDGLIAVLPGGEVEGVYDETFKVPQFGDVTRSLDNDVCILDNVSLVGRHVVVLCILHQEGAFKRIAEADDEDGAAEHGDLDVLLEMLGGFIGDLRQGEGGIGGVGSPVAKVAAPGEVILACAFELPRIVNLDEDAGEELKKARNISGFLKIHFDGVGEGGCRFHIGVMVKPSLQKGVLHIEGVASEAEELDLVPTALVSARSVY